MNRKEAIEALKAAERRIADREALRHNHIPTMMTTLPPAIEDIEDDWLNKLRDSLECKGDAAVNIEDIYQ